MIILAVIVLLAGATYVYLSSGGQSDSSQSYEVSKTDDEWRDSLSPQAYSVLRRHDTERPNSSTLNKNYSEGAYLCAGCGQMLFSSSHKFDSGTGWPSFYQPADSTAVGSRTDYKLIVARTEVHCSRCGGHLGHVFGDGPKPTGKRYCINGAALSFKASAAD